MLRFIALTTSLVLGAVFVPTNALAHWTINNDLSRLSFVTVKAGNIGEVHRFGRLDGGLDAEGQLKVEIELASVDTLIPIRDERMQNLLFETNLFPTATFKAGIDMDQVNALAVGGSMLLDVSGELTVRDTTIAIAPKLLVTRAASRTVIVNSLEPVLLNAGALDLSEGVEKLRVIAGLPSISGAVPVTFVLTFNG